MIARRAAQQQLLRHLQRRSVATANTRPPERDPPSPQVQTDLSSYLTSMRLELRADQLRAEHRLRRRIKARKEASKQQREAMKEDMKHEFESLPLENLKVNVIALGLVIGVITLWNAHVDHIKQKHAREGQVQE
ncbi:hypothetical protein JKP88DRAFT_265057 [Tribonema minus]|uniref:Uncharacterized protein n=1 Tax=Tribonema minus TaxID=303371 RepID=A0A835YM67_9STRA|nr:hypothetical protein JKP88DRAFT_265057 [Tribonema minus]